MGLAEYRPVSALWLPIGALWSKSAIFRFYWKNFSDTFFPLSKARILKNKLKCDFKLFPRWGLKIWSHIWIFKTRSKQKSQIRLQTFRSHPGKSLKSHFNLFLRILAFVSGKKSVWKNFLIKAKNRWFASQST